MPSQLSFIHHKYEVVIVTLNAYMPRVANPAKNASWKMIQKVAHTSPSRPLILIFAFNEIKTEYTVWTYGRI
jgi:hypothetical protein